VALTVLDAGVVIATLERTDVHHAAARRAIDEARTRGDRLVLPAAAYAEVLVGPSRRGNQAVMIVDAFIDALSIWIEPLSRAIAAEAALIRARHGRATRLPDALVVATAEHLRADRLITTDRRLRASSVAIEVVLGP
jgi:predicted nucleic acid-binding protein